MPNCTCFPTPTKKNLKQVKKSYDIAVCKFDMRLLSHTLKRDTDLYLDPLT